MCIDTLVSKLVTDALVHTRVHMSLLRASRRIFLFSRRRSRNHPCASINSPISLYRWPRRFGQPHQILLLALLLFCAVTFPSAVYLHPRRVAPFLVIVLSDCRSPVCSLVEPLILPANSVASCFSFSTTDCFVLTIMSFSSRTSPNAQLI